MQKIPRRVIVLLTAKAFGVSAKELDARTGRTDRQARARFAICLMLQEFRPETTQPQMAVCAGYSDRSTVNHALREGRRLIVRDQRFADSLRVAQDSILAWRPGHEIRSDVVGFMKQDSLPVWEVAA
jgi:hypothetical protein